MSMSSSTNNPAIALIIVPIVIAASAAFVALKAVGFFESVHLFCRTHWDKSRLNWKNKPDKHAHRKLRRSNLSSKSVYRDSWVELGSLDSRWDVPLSTFVNQSPRKKNIAGSSGTKSDVKSGDVEGQFSFNIYTSEPSLVSHTITNIIPIDLEEVWHPTRSTRLAWSFTNPRSPSQSHFGLSNVVKQLPAARVRDRSLV